VTAARAPGRPPRSPAGGHDSAATARDSTARGTPVIVLTYPHSGAERLRGLLARHPGLACTSGTGILPLCAQAAGAWGSAEGHAGPRLSPLAATSTRALTSAIISALLARAGGRRWCEITTADPATTGTFLQLYPGTRVLCLHRRCTDVVHAALHASTWGVTGPATAPFTASYPASTAAALTAYWAARTASLLAFEDSHPGTCRRIRHEDLADGLHNDSLLEFLSLPAPVITQVVAGPGTTNPRTGGPADRDGEAPGGSRVQAPFPAQQLPPPLRAEADRLLAQLGYPPLASGE
jgi:sulfotransferase family protein